MITCPNCGRENADNFNFCLDCGYDLMSYRESGGAAGLPEGAPTESMSSAELDEAIPQGAPVDLSGGAPVDLSGGAPVDLSGGAPVDLSGGAPVDLSGGAPVDLSGGAPVDLSGGAPVQGTPISDTSVAADGPLDLAAPAPVSEPVVTAASPSPVEHACPSCKAKMPEGMKFCGACGFKLDQNAPTPLAPAASGGRTMFMHAADLSVALSKTCKLVTIDQTGQEGERFSLKEGESACGRQSGAIVFADDPYVSPNHCSFVFKAESLQVKDKQSLNGVYVRIKEERVLGDGDLLRIGRQLFRFETMQGARDEVVRADGDDAKIWGSPNPGAFGRLVQILEDGRTGEIRLLTGEACNLGREQGELVFPTDGFISGRHCQFYKEGIDVKVKDLGSSNGTYYRVREEALVGHGDFLLVGNQMLRVEIS